MIKVLCYELHLILSQNFRASQTAEYNSKQQTPIEPCWNSNMSEIRKGKQNRRNVFQKDGACFNNPILILFHCFFTDSQRIGWSEAVSMMYESSYERETVGLDWVSKLLVQKQCFSSVHWPTCRAEVIAVWYRFPCRIYVFMTVLFPSNTYKTLPSQLVEVTELFKRRMYNKTQYNKTNVEIISEEWIKIVG